MSGPDWKTRTEQSTELTCTADAFHLKARLVAWEGDRQIIARDWDLTIPRDGV
jgi:hypothetical protein